MLNKAETDPSSNEARTIETLMRDVANMHAGEQSYMMLPSDVTDSTKTRLFDIDLIGVSGGGKQFDIEEAVRSRKQAILDSFGAGFISLGNEGSGSYALMDGKTSVHEAFVQYDLKFITEVFENQLFPQLLAINGIRIPQEKMPRMVPAPVSEENVDTWSKVIQRVASVNKLPDTKEITNELMGKLGLEYRVPEDLSDEEFKALMPTNENRSRAGDGFSTPGQGTSTQVGGGDASVSNNESGGSE